MSTHILAHLRVWRRSYMKINEGEIQACCCRRTLQAKDLIEGGNFARSLSHLLHNQTTAAKETSNLPGEPCKREQQT